MVVLAAIFYVVITPMALVMRPLRRDRLTRRFESDSESYWTRRQPPGEPARYFRQS